MFLHERDAHDDFIILLKEYSHLVEDIVVHCFTGDKKEPIKLFGSDVTLESLAG